MPQRLLLLLILRGQERFLSLVGFSTCISPYYNPYPRLYIRVISRITYPVSDEQISRVGRDCELGIVASMRHVEGEVLKASPSSQPLDSVMNFQWRQSSLSYSRERYLISS